MLVRPQQVLAGRSRQVLWKSAGQSQMLLSKAAALRLTRPFVRKPFHEVADGRFQAFLECNARLPSELCHRKGYVGTALLRVVLW